MPDMVMCGAKLVDGTGDEAFSADIAIVVGRAAEIGSLSGSSKETIAANDALIARGLIDVGSQLDGQFLNHEEIDPAFSSGVTASIAENFGAGFRLSDPALSQEFVQKC